MKFFPNSSSSGHIAKRSRTTLLFASFSGLAIALIASWQAGAVLPRWMQDAISGSEIEAALYRLMELPAAKILYPRPPKEAVHELSNLIQKSAAQAELYSLRAQEEEQALDYSAAEADWKAYASKAADSAAAKLDLADYYHRRLQATEEAAVLLQVASEPPSHDAQTRDLFTSPTDQRSWRTFERLLALIQDQDLDHMHHGTRDLKSTKKNGRAIRPSYENSLTRETYRAWIARYPQQPSLCARELNWMLDQKDYDAASDLIHSYQAAFPKDPVFPIKAAALVEYRRGSTASGDKALAIYNGGFDPLWPAELIQSYYDLQKTTHTLRGTVAQARTQLATNPDDLKAMARLFFYAQQQGNLAAALQSIDAYRLSKEQRSAPWSTQELYTLATLTESAHAYPEAARYFYALAHKNEKLSNGGSSQAEGLCGMIRILLNTPDRPLQLGANNLSLYRDIATLDRGPGYWNGILSLWFNSTNPAEEYHAEETQAQPYFYRAKAEQLLATLDQTQPRAEQRAALHRQLIQATAEYGDSSAVLREGSQFLESFNTPADEEERVAISSLMADAYAQQKNTAAEFALYDSMLAELGAATHGMPLTAAEAFSHGSANSAAPAEAEAEATDTVAPGEATRNTAPDKAPAPAFEIVPDQVALRPSPGAQAYQQLLDRYLGRLTATGHLPEALAVLRKELDRNPNDPLLYERLSTFLAQNNLSAQQEAVFEEASRKFQDPSWSSKLARLYLHEKKREAFANLTRTVIGIFHGTELEQYFALTRQGGPQLFLELNLYAHRRFPHDQVFVQNLLQAYTAKATRDPAAWEALLREHWSDSDQLRMQFFDYLSRSGKLDAEFTTLQQIVAQDKGSQADPAATRELAEAFVWQSHFEDSAPLLATLASMYPSDEDIGNTSVSVFRSLAYNEPDARDKAIAIQKQLVSAHPANTELLAAIGDIYSDGSADGSVQSSSAKVRIEDPAAHASEYWRRIPQVHPGTPDGYLQSATIFWDYFRLNEALGQIDEARTAFHQPALYGFEAGAIDEGKRDYSAALHEYVSAATITASLQADSPAVKRVLKLASRKSTSKLVDAESARALEEHPGPAAIDLRSRVLEVQKRSAEIRPLLEEALSKASSFEEAQAIAGQAQARSLPLVYEEALQRGVALVPDPVQKIELTYQLASSYESRNDLSGATELIDAEYHENPKLLGVVRATTDFYWKHGKPAQAIDTLVDASKAATAPLKNKLLVEAATKSNEAGSYKQARTLILPLLTNEDAASGDIDPQSVAIVAESYAGSGDNAGLKQFYGTLLTSLHDRASSSSEARKRNAVLVRREVIPALTHLKDYTSAVDQYVEILKAYPEDSGAIDEAALYALRYGQQPQLLAPISSTVQASSKDSRFAAMLARVQTTFGNDAAALDAYSKAVAIRSDRTDFYVAKADLEERLQRLDDACADYLTLYKLTYQNPDWMLKIATARARQGRRDEAVKALEQAWVIGRPNSASIDFQVATQLENWAMLDEAMHYAELGVKTEGDDLLAGTAPGNQNGDDPAGAATYLRIATRLRQQRKALAVLDAAFKQVNDSPNSPTILTQQVEKQGIASVTDEDWRKQRAAQRKSTAEQRYHAALLQMSTTAASYFTPEENLQFAQLVDQRWKEARTGGSNPQDANTWIEIAASAGLAEQEAAMRKQVLLDRTSQKAAAAQYQPFVALERSRMQYTELATTLGSYAKVAPAAQRATASIEEAEAYRSAGEELSEMRTLRNINLSGDDSTTLRERYLELLLKHDVSAFENYSASSKSGPSALAAPNYATAHSSWKIAQASLAAHATTFGRSWQDAYTALLGLYFRDTSPEATDSTEAAFHKVLGDSRSIADHLQQAPRPPADGEEMTGSPWFYYGMRFGVYQAGPSHGTQAGQAHDPEQLLPAGIESNPGSASGYVELAEEYAEANNPAAALDEYAHALELAPDLPSVHDQMALLLWNENKHDEAINQWRSAIVALNRIQDKGPAPESFWSNFSAITHNLKVRTLTQMLYPELDALLRNYIARNGNYRSNELLESLYLASEPKTRTAWLLSLSQAATEPDDILASVDTALWIPVKEREPILEREYELAKVPGHQAAAGETLLSDRLSDVSKRLILYYVAVGENAKAQSILSALTAEQRATDALRPAEIKLAIRENKLQDLLASWRSAYLNETSSTTSGQPVTKPSLSVIRSVASKLAEEKDTASALTLWQFVFDIGEANNDLLPSDYIGLAEAQLQVNGSTNLEAVLQVLRRMTLSSGDVYSNYDLAAGLLEKHGHPREALAFLATLSKNVPWNASYKIRFEQAQLALQQDSSGATAAIRTVAADKSVTYDQRVEAATALPRKSGQASGNQAELGSHELDLLAQSAITPQQSQQPYFIEARIAASSRLPDAQQESLLREALAIDPRSSFNSATRLKLFKAEEALKHPATALAAIEPLISPQVGYREEVDGIASTTEDSSDAEVAIDFNALLNEDSAGTGFVTASDLIAQAPLPAQAGHSDAERLALALQLSRAYEASDQEQQALAYLKLAWYLTPTSNARTPVAQRMSAIARRSALETRNATRRPLIQAGVEQNAVVRPMLVGSESKREVSQ